MCLLLGRQDLSINEQCGVGHRCDAKMLFPSGSRFVSQTFSLLLVCIQFSQHRSPKLFVVAWYEHSAVTIRKLLANTGKITGNDGHACSHGFQHRQREALVVRCQRKDLRRCKQSWDI